MLSGADSSGGLRAWCNSYAKASEKLSLLVASKIAKKAVERVVGPFDYEVPQSPLVRSLYETAVSQLMGSSTEQAAIKGKWSVEEILSTPSSYGLHEGPVRLYYTGGCSGFFSLGSSFGRMGEVRPLPALPGFGVPFFNAVEFSSNYSTSLNFRVITNLSPTDTYKKTLLSRYLRLLNVHFALRGIPFFGGILLSGTRVEVDFYFGFQTFLNVALSDIHSLPWEAVGVNSKFGASAIVLNKVPVSVVHYYKGKLSPEEKAFLTKAVGVSEWAYSQTGRLQNPIQRGFDKGSLYAWSDNYRYAVGRNRTPPTYYPRQLGPNPTGNSWETDLSKPKGQDPIFGKEMPETFTQYLKTILEEGRWAFKTYTAEQPLSESILVSMLPEIITPLLTLGSHFGNSGEGPKSKSDLTKNLYESFSFS